jgi:DNA repair exonuclease SbcCD ATPase subunit
MKITLQNFLCYTDSTFDFGNSGVALLSGPSGVGKTSILRGIFFALFGEGNKLQASGSLSCRVELEFDDIKIIRTKRPNRLVVNDVHEDDSAQEIINTKFGDTFKISGYIQQNNLNSFVLMSPIEKLSFLEKFTFRDVDLGKIKGRCKAYISQNNDALVGVVSQLEMAKKILEEIDKPTEVKFPLKCKKTEREKVIKNETIRLKNCNKMISRSENDLKILLEQISDLRVLEATLKAKNETLNELENNIAITELEIKSIKYKGDDVLFEYEKSLSSVLSLRELYSVEKQLKIDSESAEEMRLEEESKMKRQLAEYNESLWKEYSKSELTSTVDDLKKCLSDMSKIETLTEELKRFFVCSEKHQIDKSELETDKTKLKEKQCLYDKLLLQQSEYSCPSCSVKLRFVNGEIISSEKDDEIVEADLNLINQEIKILKHKISNLQKVIQDNENKLQRHSEINAEIIKISSVYEEITDIQTLKDDLEYLRNYNSSQIEMEKKKKEIELSINEEKFSSSYFTFKKSVEKLQSRRDILHQKCGTNRPVMNEEELREQIAEQKEQKNKLTCTLQRLSENQDSVVNCKKMLKETTNKHIKEYGSLQNKDDLEKKAFDEKEKLSELNEKKKIHEKNLYDIKEWEKYEEAIKNYKEWELKVKELEKMEKVARNEYASATKLKDKILEAESIAMLNIIDSINTHARVYLDCFFPDNPISVNLQTFKETKKSTKPQINIEIEYKGIEADLNMLSGGELSRVILAYTMALAEMFNTPLLLLDECTSSLDQELTETVFNAIRDNFNGKMILLIAHQVVTGTFDKIIRLDNRLC